MPDPGSPLSRRETLKKAAGALALGLGAPAALAADDDATALQHIKFEFYKRPDGPAEGYLEVPHELADKLTNRDGYIVIKRIKYVNGETGRSQDFQVRAR
jgi:hypothetical protein